MDLSNVTNIVAIAGLGAGVAGQWAVQRSRLIEMKEDLKQLRTVIDNHIQRTDIHVDPVRDQQRWSDLMRVLDRMDKRLDRLVHPATKDSDSNE